VKNGLRSFVVFFSIALVVFAMTAPTQINAQIISGDLVGTILDKTGATVADASVEAVNVATGVKYPTQANGTGEYRISNLPAGTYNVTASSASFASTTVNGFVVELNKTTTLSITLEIKGAVTSIEVSGQAAALDTTTAQLSTTFESKELADLPTSSVGLGVLNLSLLGAGVASSGGVGAGTGPTVGGQRPRNNNFTIEGVDNNNKSVTGPLVTVPNDAVAEFTLLQNQFSPEFGHSSGGQFNQVVKSGTNEFHGIAYIYNQNRNYNAVDTIDKESGQFTNPRFDSNRIGGQVGGPILKNKLFFFVNYEYDPLGQAGVAGSVCTPTAAGNTALSGIAGLSATNLGILQKYLPVSTLTAASACPSADNLVNSTDSVNGTAVQVAIPAFLAPSFNNSKFVTASIDYDISTSDQLRGRYIYNSSVGLDTSANLPAFFLSSPSKFHLVSINEYHTFTPSLTNELRLGYNRYTNVTPTGNFTFPGLDSFPNLQFNDLGQLQVGPDPSAPQFTIQNTYQLAEALTWTHGRHSLKLGIEGRKVISPQSFTQRARGDYEYNTLQTYLIDESPDSLSERSLGDPVYYGDQSAVYWYVNDNWRIRPNVTINLGLRYEYTTTPTGERTQALNSAASVPGLISFDDPRAPKNDWAPRIGIAWSPGTSGRTSIRAGFGEAFDVLYDNIGILSLPPQLSGTIDTDLTAFTPNFLADGGILPSSGGIQSFTPATPNCVANGIAAGLPCQRFSTSNYITDNVKHPQSIDYTLGVQHAFANDYTVEVRYVGTRGIHLPVQLRLNAESLVTPTLNLPTYFTAPSQATLNALPTDLNTIFNSGDGLVPAYDNAGFNGAYLFSSQPAGSSSYNALDVQVTRRFSKGFQFVGAYTWSHLIDNSTADFFSTVLTPRRPESFQDLAADRSNSALNHTHRFTLTVIYDEPFFKNSNWLVRNSLGNWEIAPIYTYQSPEYTTVQSGVDANLNGDSAPDRTVFNPAGIAGTGTGVTPLCNSTVPVGDCPTTLDGAAGSPAGVVGYLANSSTAQYVQTGYGALANVGRNTLPLKPINDIDVTALKRFTFGERYKIEFQAQAFNLFNHPQYVGGSINQINSIGFTGVERSILEPQNSNFNQPNTVFSGNTRTLQLALKIFF
jgi:hypothetical protein